MNDCPRQNPAYRPALSFSLSTVSGGLERSLLQLLDEGWGQDAHSFFNRAKNGGKSLLAQKPQASISDGCSALESIDKATCPARLPEAVTERVRERQDGVTWLTRIDCRNVLNALEREADEENRGVVEWKLW